MENKTLEFVREFNTALGETDEYLCLNYNQDGFSESITFPKQILWDDNNDNEDFQKQHTLSRLYRILIHTEEVVQQFIVDEVDKFFAEKVRQSEEKFSNIKLNLDRQTKCLYKLSVEGNYNEDRMEEFVDIFKEDFQYLFEGFKLEYEY